MKIIGKDNQGYIATFNHTELEKFMNLYYGKLQRLDVGAEVDLGRGYDYAQDTADAMKKTRDFIAANGKVVEAILSGLTISAAIKEPVAS